VQMGSVWVAHRFGKQVGIMVASHLSFEAVERG